jgi:hypothetical protein
MPRGSQPGERRGGRLPGVPNKATAALKAFAGKYTTVAITSLVAIAQDTETPPAARVAAWREVLDRAVGKAPQALTDAEGNNLRAIGDVTIVMPVNQEAKNRT